MMDSIDIAEVARRTGISARALRFYEARGLLKPLRTASGRRHYGPGELATLHQILALKRAGLTLAQVQRLLWASTGTKDPTFPDTLYLDELIGPDTVNTVPPKTLDAFRERGTARETLTSDIDAARHVIAETKRLGLDLEGVTATLSEEGVASFTKSFDDLLGSIAAKHPAEA
jgi:DNA-binding transcriptional MerR regulator